MRKFFIPEEILRFLIDGCGYTREDAAHFLLDLTMYWDEEEKKEALLAGIPSKTLKELPQED